MSKQEIITTWSETRKLTPEDMNRVEGNLKYILEETAEFDGPKTFNDGVTITSGETVDDLEVTGDFIADGVSSTVTTSTLITGGINVSSEQTLYSAVFVITEPCSVYGEITGTITVAGAGSYSATCTMSNIEAVTDIGYLSDSFSSGVAGLTRNQAGTYFNEENFRILAPGSYRLVFEVRESGTTSFNVNVTYFLKRFGVFGKNAV